MQWRDEPTFYNVLVSEIMLQQTQVERVQVKFAEFMHAFPNEDKLAEAKLSDVLKVWQGLGYNRRAKYLHMAAKYITENGTPNTFNQMVKLPGIGKNTAGALMNYVYNSPTPFVETNIRTVYFYHFFAGRSDVSDGEVLKMVERTMNKYRPREWFWALMDYGSWLKSQGYSRLDISRHYKKQSKLEGSVRQVRGQIVRALAGRTMTKPELMHAVGADHRFDRALEGLLSDGLVTVSGNQVRLTE